MDRGVSPAAGQRRGVHACAAAACIGARSHKGELEALLRKEDAALAAGFALTPANLEQIMVHLEREAEA